MHYVSRTRTLGCVSTRRRALDAAVTLIGTEGIRALTHGRVDAAAGLPAGSTSNHFRTRAALVAGVIEHLADQERAELGAADATPIRDVDALLDMLAGGIAVQTGPLAARTRARYALFLESGSDPELLRPLHDQRRRFETLARAILADIGAAHDEPAVRAFMAGCEGLVLHRITVDPDAPIRPTLERLVRACLTEA